VSIAFYDYFPFFNKLMFSLPFLIIPFSTNNNMINKIGKITVYVQDQEQAKDFRRLFNNF
jgi:hypothetical protein